MYWQVYLHKTVVSAENLLINILRRAKELIQLGVNLFSTPALQNFLSHDYSLSDFISNKELLNDFAALDDSDISASVKVWSNHSDKILGDLCRRLINRKLFKIILQDKPFDDKFKSDIREKIKTRMEVDQAGSEYYLLEGKLVNNAYNSDNDKINILYRNGNVCDIAEAADTLNIKNLSHPVEKYYLCFPDIIF